MFISKFLYGELNALRDRQVQGLQEQIVWLKQGLQHERARAEAAIDTLLAEKANVAAIRNADIQREQAIASQDARAPGLDPKLGELRKVFEAMGGVGDDAPETDEERRHEATTGFAMIGGLPVEGKHV